MKIVLVFLIAILVTRTASNKAFSGELLYNGIRLPDQWPPKLKTLTRKPLARPDYLTSPPAVIPIDVGRQLFVDDFLIAETTLTRAYHQAEYLSNNPVLQPDKSWEGTGGAASAMVFSDGVWFDPTDQLFKMWYLAPGGLPRSTYYATSRDGIHWDKPSLDVVPGTNAVFQDEPDLFRDSNTIWLDLDEKNPERRFKMFRVVIGEREIKGKKQKSVWMKIHFSPDGIHWKLVTESDSSGDRSTVFYNPFRKVWVYGIRDGTKEVSRCRSYYEHSNLLEGARWKDEKSKKKSTLWIGADQLDLERHNLNLPDSIPSWDQVPVQLYNLDCVAYESLMLGLFSIWRGQPKDRPKINEVCVGFSRDGFHWTRPDRRAFCPVSEKEGDWNWGNVQSAGGCCLVVKDKLYFYVSGRAGIKGTKGSGRCSTGLATLRRDGFTSMDAGQKEGLLTTRPIQFNGRYLFVNTNTAKGRLLVEVVDKEGKVLSPFTLANSVLIHADSTIKQVQWKNAQDLSPLVGKPVRFRFHLQQGELYSFWVSPEKSGASRGYVAAGGPGFTGATDTVGLRALK